MSSEALAHDEPLPAYGEPRPAYGEPLAAAVEAIDDVEERFDHGKDWPLAFALFAPVLAAYGAIGYGVYVAASTLL
jgi:hypothetical protein